MYRATLAGVLLGVVGLTGSCGYQRAASSRARARDDHTITTTPATGEVAGRPTYSMPIPIPGRATCVIPFGVETTKGWFQDADPFSRGGMPSKEGYGYPSTAAPWHTGAWGGSVRWHNAIVRDMQTGDEWTILDQRGVVSQWWVFGPRPPKDEPFRSAAMVFIATTRDSNGDGLINDMDANVAILADADGRNPRVASPSDAQVWTTAYDDERGHIYLFVVTDTSADGRFGTEDAGMPYVLKTDGAGQATPVLSDRIRAKVESVLR